MELATTIINPNWKGWRIRNGNASLEINSENESTLIPPICKHLMRMYAYRELSPLDDDWEGWKISKEKLITPDGWPLTPDRIIMGNTLIEIGAEDELRFQREVLRTARMLKRNKFHKNH
ncbi:DUF3653 domain-containing protein [Photobacterium phosphoreum]|uniref:DUF3653 domain-containing protein n=1 Tax=Photobacterium phosphoreum TaxID=659 RepID=UPI0015E73FCA|nr:DUF3653 domain-containing protein [Photobacterium phosphoreum]